MAERYLIMDVVLMTSIATQTWTEQFGRVIVEAQAAGAAVVGSASGPISGSSGPRGSPSPK